MKFKPSNFSLSMLLLGLTVGVTGLACMGCGEKEPAPTNTGNSKYIDTGNTAADKIGADRARAHRRLPNGVAPPQ